ncbi:MAG: radical SAM protein [Acidaminococcales bacterium]|nr:radical SAM protein [Acidaminococcales bacterium]
MDIKRIREIHPCFGAKHNKGRMHLPVCPACNIECRFCSRKINAEENRPGVTASIIKPQDAVFYVERAVRLCPDITVVGIAGPGDSLVTDNALETFRLIGKKFPQLIKCMSTNGLLLSEKATDVIDAGVDTLTVTVNAVDPKIQAEIIGGIVFHGQRREGAEGAKILIENQLEGIAKVTAAGVKVKVNTVLINEINLAHVKETAKAVAEAGASLYNIIPLIPQHELSYCREPSCEDIGKARKEAGEYIELFLHCQRCRADAVGIPGGRDFSQQVYFGQFAVKETFSHG